MSVALRYASGPAAVDKPATPVLVACAGQLAASIRRWASFGGPPAVHAPTMHRAMAAVEVLGRPRAVIASSLIGGGTGVDLLQRVHAMHPGLPAVILLSSPRPSDVLRARQLGATCVEETSDAGRLAGAVVRCALASLPHAREADLVIDAFASARELSRRERQILALFARGVPRSDLAEVMGVRENTLKTEIRSLLAKCQCASLEEVFRHLFLLALRGDAARLHGEHGGHGRSDG